jgi:4-aminobutyrate aminotransferase / (S)-3-amino-2-methylpropionate transaminase / 5-aminovalerate transaminase
MSGYSFDRSSKKVPLIQTEFRKIQTSIPVEGTETILSELDRYESRSMHGQLPIVWDKAVDSCIFDAAGNQWIDFTSTIFVTNIGHSNPHLISSLKDTLDNELLHTYAYPNKIRARYHKKLIEFTQGGFEKAFLMSAGTEACEAALKLMRLSGQKKGKCRLGIVTLEGNWHGRTMGAQLMSSNLKQKQWIGHSDPDIHHIPFPYPWALQDSSPEEFLQSGLDQLKSNGLDLQQDVCGFMLETFQGWGAVFYPREFVQSIAELCRKNNILLAFDEMQSGFGRTGKRFGYEHYKVKPDLICCGKGMGSGYPLSGVLGKAEVMDLPEVANMSSTHSANPLACSAGLATIEEIENRNLVDESATKGSLLHQLLNKIKTKYRDHISYVFGTGLIAAVLFKVPGSEKPDHLFPSRVAEACMQKGLLVVHTGRESIKIGPPLTISEKCLREGLEVLDEAIQQSIE